MKAQVLTLFISGLFYFTAFPQYVLNGSVSDQDGNVLGGATVRHMDSYLGTVVNTQGRFTLRFQSAGAYAIAISHVGYETFNDTVVIDGEVRKDYTLQVKALLSDEFVVEATRAGHQTPVTHENFTREDIDQVNLAQDLPILLNQGVSVVTTSDAGAGVGYTGLRIRGSDGTRINVTVNGIPINDSESHSVFWVNMPDLASSTSGIQIQRGVGTSTNGAAVFGASINIETSSLDSAHFVEVNNTYGSFNTRKHSVIMNSGLVDNNWNFEGRYSIIQSDGYIDRSAANLRSFYLSGGYYGKRWFSKLVVLSGNERTQQAWWGTPESRLQNDDQAMLEHAANNGYNPEQTTNLLTSGRTYNHYVYENEIDLYGQDHLQWINGIQLSRALLLSVSAHFTRGEGYFEQFKYDEEFSALALTAPIINSDTMMTTDAIVRRWLDNDFYGTVYSLQYTNRNWKATVGGSANRYTGAHFGEVVWSRFNAGANFLAPYYSSDARKDEYSNYARVEYGWGRFHAYADMQVRHIEYVTKGTDNDQRVIDIQRSFDFFNPKAGVQFAMNHRNSLYATLARSSREPIRSDFIDAQPGRGPRPEFLTNAEAGWNHSDQRWTLGINAYYMHYKDQLVLTGALNDVGSPVRTNVSSSYRAGVESMVRFDFGNGLFWMPNATLSRNTITSFDAVVYDYTSGYQERLVSYKRSDISFSPTCIAGSQLGVRTSRGLSIVLRSKWVSQQYLDNTSNPNRVLPAYHTHDVLLSFVPKLPGRKMLEFSLLINNVLNHLYSSNGYTYSYIYGAEITENFYYPQAGTNWLAAVKVRF